MWRCRRDRVRSYAALLATAVTLCSCGVWVDPPETYETIVAAGAIAEPGGDGVTVDIEGSDIADLIVDAQEWAAERGAAITVALLDRETGARVVGGVDELLATASVVKLFIADELLFRYEAGDIPLSEEELSLIGSMLEASDDSAASTLWELYGGVDLVTAVAARRGLTDTVGSELGWWNSVTTASDLLTWYDGILTAATEDDDPAATVIVSHLLSYAEIGTDGYDQKFGLPDALGDDAALGMKAGWMCCLDGGWVHLSTGFFGDDHRYVMVVDSRETVTYEDDEDVWFLPDTSFYDATDDASARHARDTVTSVTEKILGAAATH